MTSDTHIQHTKRIAAYAAAAWAFIFALMSFYWAAGGTLGLNTLGEGMEALALSRDQEILAVVIGTGVIKVIAGLFALALAHLPTNPLIRRFMLIGGWAAGVLLTLYGIASLIEHILMITGSRRIPDLLGTTSAVYWHMAVWDPFWILGGLLFLAATGYARKTT